MQNGGDSVYAEAETIDAVSDETCRESYRGAEKQITGIVYSHVDARVTGDDSPKHEKGGDSSVFEQ